MSETEINLEDAKKLLEFFKNERNLKELIDLGITEMKEDGHVRSPDGVIAFFPKGCKSPLKQLYDSESDAWVGFHAYLLERLLRAAERFGVSIICVSTDKALPLFIKTKYGDFAIAPQLRRR